MLVDPAAETMPVEQRREAQQRDLRALVDRLLAADGLQGRRLRAAGVDAGAAVRLEDLPRLPTVGKADLWAHYPFGLRAVPAERVVAVHGSSGTGGRPTLVPYTRADLALWARMCARALGAAGAGPGTIVHNAYGYGLFTGGVGIHQGAVELGATVVPVSSGLTARQVTLVRDIGPQLLCCTPSYAVTLGEALRAEGVASPFAAGLFGAEPWSEALRAQLEELLGIAALDIYGLSEVIGPGVASECLEGRAGLHVNEDQFLVEVVDPADGSPVAEGHPGELVFSTPTKEALPLLRYRTGDIAALSGGPCGCGRTLVRMSKVLGRRDDMLVVRGVNVYPSEVEAVLLADDRLAPHYQLVFDRRSPGGRLIVACEVFGADPWAVRGELAAALRGRLGLRAEVAVLPSGSLPRLEAGKAVRVVVWDGGPPPVPRLLEVLDEQS